MKIGQLSSAGFALYPLFKIFSGRAKELTAGTWVLFGIAILLLVFYPYGKV